MNTDAYIRLLAAKETQTESDKHQFSENDKFCDFLMIRTGILLSKTRNRIAGKNIARKEWS